VGNRFCSIFYHLRQYDTLSNVKHVVLNDLRCTRQRKPDINQPSTGFRSSRTFVRPCAPIYQRRRRQLKILRGQSQKIIYVFNIYHVSYSRSFTDFIIVQTGRVSNCVYDILIFYYVPFLGDQY